MTKRPNILWICTDQQRWDTLSCLGFKGANTPNIDKLASQGVVFKNAYCQSPICTPSRASFLTGMYPIANQVHRNGNDGFPDHLPLVPKLLQEAGYHTGLVGKLHLSRTKSRVECRPDDGYTEFYRNRGLVFNTEEDCKEHDYYDWLTDKGVDAKALYEPFTETCAPGVPTDLHLTTWAGDRSKSFIERNSDKSWLLSVNLYDPHPPFDPPAEYLDQFDPNDMPGAKFMLSDLEHQKRFAKVDQQAQNPVIPDDFDCGFEDRQGAMPPAAATTGARHDTPPTKYNVREYRAAYHAMILLIDDMVGRLLGALEATGQLENTLIVFTSDHGEMLGDHGLIYKGCRFYEGLVHVPLVMSCPSLRLEGLITDALAELVDIAPTLLDAAGTHIPKHMQGKSLMPFFQNDVAPQQNKDFVTCEYFDAINFPGSHGSRGSMYFDGRYKLNVYHDIADGELFDLKDDPNEFNDLWFDPVHEELKSNLLLKHLNAMIKASGAGTERTADY